ncbi:hypothetical protein SUGI_0342750 [Cryptomeria japonica]|nr:hypothetical protein SUGI_0342750 [Cryptomeria japonica]
MGVPVIDVKNIDGGDRKAIMAQIAQACQSPGFFQIVNHSIDHGLLDRVKEVCSQQYKINRQQNFKDSLPVRALNRAIEAEAKGNNVEKIENMDWEDVFQVHEMKDTNSWPSEPKEFKEIIEEFRNQIFNLTEKLLEIISESLGLEKGYLKRAFAGEEKPFFGTKVSHYPPCPRPDLIKGIRAHTDAGDPIQAVSNGKYKSAWHRILPTKDGNRLSVASFYNPSYNALVSPAPQLIAQAQSNGNAAHELSTYPKYSFGDYMKIYSQQKFEEKEPRFKAVGRLNEQISC